VSAGSRPPFTRDRWRRLIPLLEQGLEIQGAARVDWLERLRAGDPALADDVAALLSRHADLQRDRFLAEPMTTRPAAGSLAGLVVGDYTLRVPLGQGGMGSVWLADRSDGRFTGQAAVKLLNASLVGREGEARFRREASILARLRHPHIARLLDAGVSALGQPYIVLEHVDGERIDRSCDAGDLDLPGRIRVFLEVVDAVAHAHANLIVHRDLKPQNVLVDREGRARLLDFGIARLIDASPDGSATVTREGASALTPEYAAPEQVTGGDLTTATDVYSLGVLLCVLLTGRHPAGVTRGTPAEWIRTIVDVDARPMSDLVAGTSRATLRTALRGDLDNIVAKALRKAPHERYHSAEAFAADLRRYLNHEPVSARPDTLAYRAAKFVRRNPVGVAAAALAVAGTVLFTAGIAWQAREARRQRDEASLQMARATATREFMGFLLGAASTPGTKPTSGDLLAQSEALIDKEYAGSEPLQAEMLVSVGEQYIGSERLEKAAPILERAAAIAGRSGDPALQARALCPLAMLRMMNGAQDEANALMQRALEGLPDDSLHAWQRVECLVYRGEFGFFTDQGEPMKRDGAAALALLDHIPIPATAKRIEAQAVVAYGHYLAKENRAADALYAEVMRGLEQAGRDKTLMAADTCNNWALVHYRGNISRAEPLCRRSVELRRAIEGADAIAPSVTFNHAGVLLQLARYDEAERLYEESIRTARARKEALIETDAMLELSQLYVEKGELERAAAQLRTLGPLLTGPHPDPYRKVQMAYFQGRLLLARGEAAAARDQLAAAVEVLEKRKSQLSLFVFALVGLARAHLALGDSTAAVAMAGRALEVANGFVEPDEPSYLVGLSQAVLAEASLAAGDRDRARTAFGKAVEHLTITLGEAHPATVAARRGLETLGA
jgi:serine/threonine-protein kinase